MRTEVIHRVTQSDTDEDVLGVPVLQPWRYELPLHTSISSQPPFQRAIVPDELAAAELGAACVALGLARPDEIGERFAHGSVWRERWRVRDADAPVAAGMTLTVHVPPGGVYPDVRLGAADIVWEDEVLLVVNKPPGMYVNETPWDDQGHVLAALRRFVAERDGVPPQLHLAHQLDRDTSGVLILTKDRRANAPLQKMFMRQTIRKTYWALCAGQPPHDAFIVESGHGRGKNGLFRLYPVTEVGTPLPITGAPVRYMATEFAVRQRWHDVALVEAHPRTGRTHQIRLHLYGLGLPVLGDGRYEGPRMLGEVALTHHLLHAQRLQFRHPLTNVPLDFTAPPPPLFTLALNIINR